jgi:glycosyltransferase involved in cell wall biosynthesis
VADAITRLLLDEQLASRLGRAGAERARRFAWPIIVERVERVLLELLEMPNVGSPAAELSGDGETAA